MVVGGSPLHLSEVEGVGGSPLYGQTSANFSQVGGKRRKRTKRTKRTKRMKRKISKRRTRRSKGKRTRRCKCKTCRCNPCKCVLRGGSNGDTDTPLPAEEYPSEEIQSGWLKMLPDEAQRIAIRDGAGTSRIKQLDMLDQVTKKLQDKTLSNEERIQLEQIVNQITQGGDSYDELMKKTAPPGEEGGEMSRDEEPEEPEEPEPEPDEPSPPSQPPGPRPPGPPGPPPPPPPSNSQSGPTVRSLRWVRSDIETTDTIWPRISNTSEQIMFDEPRLLELFTEPAREISLPKIKSAGEIKSVFGKDSLATPMVISGMLDNAGYTKKGGKVKREVIEKIVKDICLFNSPLTLKDLETIREAMDIIKKNEETTLVLDKLEKHKGKPLEEVFDHNEMFVFYLNEFPRIDRKIFITTSMSDIYKSVQSVSEDMDVVMEACGDIFSDNLMELLGVVMAMGNSLNTSSKNALLRKSRGSFNLESFLQINLVESPVNKGLTLIDVLAYWLIANKSHLCDIKNDIPHISVVWGGGAASLALGFELDDILAEVGRILKFRTEIEAELDELDRELKGPVKTEITQQCHDNLTEYKRKQMEPVGPGHGVYIILDKLKEECDDMVNSFEAMIKKMGVGGKGITLEEFFLPVSLFLDQLDKSIQKANARPSLNPWIPPDVAEASAAVIVELAAKSRRSTKSPTHVSNPAREEKGALLTEILGGVNLRHMTKAGPGARQTHPKPPPREPIQGRIVQRNEPTIRVRSVRRREPEKVEGPQTAPASAEGDDATVLRNFYETFPAAVEETTADGGAVGWEDIEEWGDEEWEEKIGKIIANYKKKADKAAKKGKGRDDVDFRKIMYDAIADKYDVEPSFIRNYPS